MPETLIITDKDIQDRGYREVVVIEAMPFGRFKKGDRLLAFHKMRIFIPTGISEQYVAYDIDAQLFDHYLSPVIPSDPIIIPIQ